MCGEGEQGRFSFLLIGHERHAQGKIANRFPSAASSSPFISNISVAILARVATIGIQEALLHPTATGVYLSIRRRSRALGQHFRPVSENIEKARTESDPSYPRIRSRSS